MRSDNEEIEPQVENATKHLTLVGDRCTKQARAFVPPETISVLNEYIRRGYEYTRVLEAS